MKDFCVKVESYEEACEVVDRAIINGAELACSPIREPIREPITVDTDEPKASIDSILRAREVVWSVAFWGVANGYTEAFCAISPELMITLDELRASYPLHGEKAASETPPAAAIPAEKMEEFLFSLPYINGGPYHTGVIKDFLNTYFPGHSFDNQLKLLSERAALAAEASSIRSAEPTPWDGTGIPPVGTVCEFRYNSTDFAWCKVKYHSDAMVLERDWGGETVYVSKDVKKIKFRPIRTDRERFIDSVNYLFGIDAGEDPQLEARVGTIWDVGLGRLPESDK